jgi:hypothetical protein
MTPNLPGPVAVLSQARPAPAVDGIFNPDWYGDSSADIAFALRSAGVPVLTPVSSPDPGRPGDWVFPDTETGLMAAYEAGARVLWSGSGLRRGHPLLKDSGSPVRFVGQDPAQAERWDDKWFCNERLREHGLPVARSILVGRAGTVGVLPLGDVKPGLLAALGLAMPLVIKPVRGRSGEGVKLVDSVPKLVLEVIRLIEATAAVNGHAQSRFGARVMVEEYLPGAELAITVMPPGHYEISGKMIRRSSSWCLPPVNVNGTILDAAERRAPHIAALLEACAAAGNLAGMRWPIQIDCRQHADGTYLLFDLNTIPALTGRGRPGGDDGESPPVLAAKAIGWSFADLLKHLLMQSG